MRPCVSVLLPVHRAADYIGAALRSLWCQTLPDFECIVIANDSDAATLAVIRELHDPRLRLIQLDKANLVRALNAGLDAARADILVRMDADDICRPDRLAKQLRHLQSNPHISVSATRVQFQAEDGRSPGFARYVEWQNSLLSADQIYSNRFIESPVAHPSVALRTAALKDLGGYRSGPFPEDYDLWLRLLEQGHRIEKLPESLLVWRDHPRRLSRSDPRIREEAFHRLKVPYLLRALPPAVRELRRPLYVWGAGRVSRRFAPLLEDASVGLRIAAFLDVDPRKIGRRLYERPVYSFEKLRMNNGDQVTKPFVLSYVPGAYARNLICEYLAELGWQANVDYLLCA